MHFLTGARDYRERERERGRGRWASTEFSFWRYLLVVAALVLFAGLMSGLTLGLMSLGLVDLQVLMKSGSRSMQALPIFLDSLINAWGAILISVTMILLFGEIFPQAVCSRYGLAVGAAMTPVVRVLVILFFPVTYPISKLLDYLLGKSHVALCRRAELMTLVHMHGNEEEILDETDEYIDVHERIKVKLLPPHGARLTTAQHSSSLPTAKVSSLPKAAVAPLPSFQDTSALNSTAAVSGFTTLRSQYQIPRSTPAVGVSQT